jgi:molecular chaperone DnaK
VLGAGLEAQRAGVTLTPPCRVHEEAGKTVTQAIGIDLGTTFSAVAFVNSNGRPEIIKNREGETITPSVVLFQGDLPLIGTMAKRSAVMAPEDVVQFVKRQMGDPVWRFMTSSGVEYTAEQVSGVILKRLKEDAELALGRPCLDSVITVPAYFDDARRRATTDAGTIAGFNVLRVLNEPTAAALAYGLDEMQAGTCLVYDLGGGTFDVTVMRIADGVFDVLSTTGDRNLGGFDFDNALMRWVNQQVLDQGGPNLLDDDRLDADLRDKCEMAKRMLSTTHQARVFMSASGRNFQIQVTREQFESLTAELLQRTHDMMDEALDDARLSYADIDRVLLVGGSTRMPMVGELVARVSGKQPELSVNPDEVVALGAAIQADIVAAESHGQAPALASARPLVVRDVCSQSLGVIAVEDKMGRLVKYNSVIVPHNSKIPHKRSESYQTVQDNQTQLEIEVTEGDDRDVNYVTVVGKSLLTIPSYPAGAPIEVIMSYDIDGVIHVEVVDSTSGKHLGEFEIDREANLDQAEVERMRTAMSALGVS